MINYQSKERRRVMSILILLLLLFAGVTLGVLTFLSDERRK